VCLAEGKHLSRGRTASSPALPASAGDRGVGDAAVGRQHPGSERAATPMEV